MVVNGGKGGIMEACSGNGGVAEATGGKGGFHPVATSCDRLGSCATGRSLVLIVR